MSSPSRAVSETPGDIERCESGRDSSTPRRGGDNRLRRAGALDDLDKGVCRNRVEPLHGSARPSNLYGIDLRARGKSKVEARVTARQIAVAGAPLRALHEARGADGDDGPHRAAVDGAAFEINNQEVAAVTAIVAEQRGCAIEIVDDQIRRLRRCRDRQLPNRGSRRAD